MDIGQIPQLFSECFSLSFIYRKLLYFASLSVIINSYVGKERRRGEEKQEKEEVT